MAEADQYLPEDATYLLQDVSVLFGGDSDDFDFTRGSPEWTVLAACSDAPWLEDSDTIEIAAAPTQALTAGTIRAARAGRYRDTVSCEF
ncbi:hypothetical protein [Agromyces archimandritae]|uniref:Uncharacterized protein n=1 Tax=Agromyces archimandritae TaxID=2781962 RepID=A0A975IMI6_9MICO|nr:hypothetical protein [Agromyces archimandritae]QTX03547.1 hypothetical protein G127AT_09285 [Agromyces archimandritae]